MSALRTDELIQHLASNVRPVRCLRSPFARTSIWVAWSLPWVVAVVFIMGLRPDIDARLSDVRWLTEQGAALATAITAAMAALCAGVPGRPHWERLIPLVPLAVWLGTLGQGCIQDWVSHGDAALVLRQDWQCLPRIIFIGAGPAVAMTALILRGSAIAPALTVAFGALAAGGLAAVGLRLFHQEDASLMVLVWQAGTVFGLTFLAALSGRQILRWRHLSAY